MEQSNACVGLRRRPVYLQLQLGVPRCMWLCVLVQHLAYRMQRAYQVYVCVLRAGALYTYPQYVQQDNTSVYQWCISMICLHLRVCSRRTRQVYWCIPQTYACVSTPQYLLVLPVGMLSISGMPKCIRYAITCNTVCVQGVVLACVVRYACIRQRLASCYLQVVRYLIEVLAGLMLGCAFCSAGLIPSLTTPNAVYSLCYPVQLRVAIRLIRYLILLGSTPYILLKSPCSSRRWSTRVRISCQVVCQTESLKRLREKRLRRQVWVPTRGLLAGVGAHLLSKSRTVRCYLGLYLGLLLDLLFGLLLVAVQEVSY